MLSKISDLNPFPPALVILVIPKPIAEKSATTNYVV